MAATPLAPLVGVWELERADEALALAPGSFMAFLPTGELRYAAPRSDGSAQVALLTYRIEGEWIVTDQPSAAREQRTRFRLPDRDRLELTYDGGRATFRRAG